MASSSMGSSAFTVASVPTAMKAGVSTRPCGVMNTPARPGPTLAIRSNVNVTSEVDGSRAEHFEGGHGRVRRAAVPHAEPARRKRFPRRAQGIDLELCGHGAEQPVEHAVARRCHELGA